MQSSQLNKAINIMRRTGDRLIIMDQETDETIVLINIESYEKMLNSLRVISGLNEEEMINKINRDIALWRAHNESDSLKWYSGDAMAKRKSTRSADVISDIFQHDTSSHDNKWNNKYTEEESLMDVPSEEEPQFYMEPIE